MFRFKHIILLMFTCIMLISCEDNTDTSFKLVEKSDLFKLSMNEKLNFGNLDESGANKTHSQSVTIKNSGQFAMQVDLPETGSEDLTITTADNFANPLHPGMSYNFKVNYAPKTFGDKSLKIDMSEYLYLPKDNIVTAGPGQGTINTSDIHKATFINENNQEFDGIFKVDAKYSEITNPQITADTGKLIDFGNIGKNNTAVRDIILENIGDGNAIISNMEIIADNRVFSIILPENFKGHFQPGKKEGFQVQAATGNLIGGASGKLVISSNSINSPYIIDLRVQGDKPDIDFGGSGGQNGGGQIGGTDDNGNELDDGEVSGSIDFDTNTIDFGLVSLNKPRLQKIVFKNNNDSVLAVKDAVISGADLAVNQAKTTCIDTLLYKGDSCDLFIEFTPTIAQVYTGLVQIQSQIGNDNVFSIDFATKGEGIEPKLETVKELSFSRVNLGEQKSKDIILKNIGKDILEISDIFLDIDSSILNEDVFSINSSACIKRLKHNEECKIIVGFKPSEYGEAQGNLIIKSNDALLTHNIKLSGIGTGSSISMNNEVELGSHKNPVNYDLEIFNNGYDTVTINAAEFAIKKNFKIKENSCSVLESGKSCIIKTEFTPPTDGSLVTDILTIVFNDSDRYNVMFSGSGAQPKAELSNNGEMIDFGRINVYSEGIYSLYIHNIGNAPLYLSEFAIQDMHGHDEYKISENSCTSEIAPDGMCEIKLAVTPTHGGTINDKLSFKSNELVNNVYNINLTAEAIFSDYALNATSLNFGEKYVYPEQTYNKDVNITNTGTEAITIKNATVINGFFDATNNCSKLNASESCNINVKVTPTKAGDITDTLRITTDVATAPIKEVPLRIKGLDRVFTITPADLNFGILTIDEPSSNKTVTLTNTGNVNLSIQSIVASSPFAIVSKTCQSSLAPDETCNVLINVTPNTVGEIKGALTIKTDALRDSTKIVELSATGQKLSELSVNVTSMDFGEKYIYPSQSYNKPFTITNNGSKSFTVSAISTTGSDYTVEHSCIKTLQGGESCSGLVKITPNRAGDITGNLNIVTDADINPTKSISLHMRGLDKVFTVSPASLNFGSVPVGSASTTKAVTIRNTGNVNLAVSSITATSPFTVASKTCGASLTPNATCVVNVKVTPTAPGANTGSLNIVTDALRENTKTVALSVTGTTSSYSISTTTLDFGTVEYGRESATKTITVTNTGSLPITFSAPTISEPYKIKSNTCNTLQVGAKCTIGVAVTADRVGTISGTLEINSNAIIEKEKILSMNINIRYYKDVAGSYNVLLSQGEYIITLYSGTGSKVSNNTSSSISGKNININLTGSDQSNSQVYKILENTILNISLGEKGVTDNSLGIFEYEKENTPENCSYISGDMHDEIWKYECFEWGEDGKVIIEAR